MKMWSVNVIFLLLFCYASLSTGNGKAYFVSNNFYNVLHWDPVKPAFPGEKVLYSVKYWSDVDQKFKIKEECQNIAVLTCNLTAETPSVPDVQYQARVFVNGSLISHTLNRFKPIAHTNLGPPILSTYTTVSSLYVNVTLPLGPNGVSIADIISKSKNGPSKNVIVYTLNITEPKWAALVNQTTTGHFVINLKNNQTKYCGHVVYKPSAEWGRNRSQKASFCVTLQSDSQMLLPWIFISVALLVATVVMSVVWICNYVKGGKHSNMPQSLVATPGTPSKVLQSPDRNIIISTPEVRAQSDQIIYATIQMKPNVPAVRSGGYSPQDIPCQAWQGSTNSSVGTRAHSPTPNPEDTSAQSSEIYSAVAVHVPAEENDDFQQATIKDRETELPSNEEPWDKGGTTPKFMLRGVPPSPDLDAYESNPARPLLLHAVRGANGQLMLPSLTLQLQSKAGDTASPFNSERKPLLSDLIECKMEGPSLVSLQSFDSSEWSDSGWDESTLSTPTQPYCNTHYCPSRPVAPDFQQQCQETPSSDVIFESGYKQNWIPGVLLRTAPIEGHEQRRTNYPSTWTVPRMEGLGEGDEDKGGGAEERLKQILLGGWVQIQE
ncbi:interferon lambda receptor 1 [Toxotes jaculatrix]|uniref:interferon lambda receptor 1 n=1 Tax=Toxotes jaculatrix TaxID=941984 RepID=UPI001B3AE3EE|nr:interferon lambda receptor 1 [Toxotes jaculatrix]